LVSVKLIGRRRRLTGLRASEQTKAQQTTTRQETEGCAKRDHGSLLG
jgi:hypothetical protein